MSTMRMSNESLWSILSGTSKVYSDDIIGNELKAGKEKFLKGILYYSESSKDDKKTPDKSLPPAEKDLLVKIVKLLDVPAPVAEELLDCYLASEFRGTARSLAALLSSERHQQVLLVSVWRFYYTERLYLLMGLRQIIARHGDGKHPFQRLFSKFLDLLDQEGGLLDSLLDQLELAVMAEPPCWRQHEALSTPAARETWVSSTLKEQAELLQCLLTYCKQRRPADPSQLQRLVAVFARHALGHAPPYAQLLTEQHTELLRSVSVMETVVFLHGLQLNTLLPTASGSRPGGPGLSAPERRALDGALPHGSRPEHGPALLGWLLVLHAAGEDEPRRRHLAKRCRHLDVLKYLRTVLTDAEIIAGRTSMIGKIAREAIYNLMNLLLLWFDASNLGDEKDLIAICAEVLTVPELAGDLWSRGPDLCGLRLLLDEVAARFPADAVPLLELCAGLAQAGPDSLTEVIQYLQLLPTYCEPAAAVPGGAAAVEQAGRAWQLRAERRPDRRLPELQLPAGTRGRLLPGPAQLVCWHAPHSGWQQVLLILRDLQEEGQLGEQLVEAETTERAGAVARLLRAALESGPPELVADVRPHIDIMFPILERHYRWASPPQAFVHEAAEVLALVARLDPEYVWKHMDRNRLLPRGGAGEDPVLSVEAGRLGELIEAHECVQRRYPLTQAYLHLLYNTVEAAPDRPPAGLAAAVAFVLRDVFPAHVRWQFARRGEQTALGRACMRLFDALLPLHAPGPLRDMVVHALTDTPAAETLLTLVVHGEARIVMLLEEQTHWDTGAGLEFIRLIHVALSVLNRLLVLRCRTSEPDSERTSLLERLLTSQPAGRGQLRPVLAIAQYLFHRHNPHLPTLAIRILLRLARVFPMSLLASFGQDSDVICSVILRRLSAESEDVNMKVAVLDFIATCVTSQPGLLQRLLGVDVKESEDGAKKRAEQDDEAGFLEELLLILKNHSKSCRWSSPLLLAAVSLVHALWLGQCGAALSHLTAADTFWSDLTAPLTSAGDGAGPPPPPLLAAHVLRTLALHLYYARQPDAKLKTVLARVTGSQGEILHRWSKLVCEATGGLSADLNTSLLAVESQQPGSEERQEEGANLLLAWRDFCLVLASAERSVKLSAESQEQILLDLMTSLENHLSSDGQPRLVNILSELIMMLAARWTQLSGGEKVRKKMWSLLEVCSTRFEELTVRTRTAVLTTALGALQRSSLDMDESVPSLLVEPCCRMLEAALAQCEPAESPAAAERLAGLAALLLRRLLAGRPAPLPAAALPALGRRLRQRRQPRLCEHLLQAALAAARHPDAARTSVSAGLAAELCLPLAELRQQLGAEFNVEWRSVWILSLHLWTVLLRSQRHFFVADAIDFAAVHCSSLCIAVSQLRTTLQPADLEETEAAVSFLATLLGFSKQWRQQHRHSFDTLLPWVKGCVGICFWYVARTRIVSLMLERRNTLVDREELRRVRRLSSTEPEPEKPEPEVTSVQNRLLRLSSVCLVALYALSPPLADLVTQDGLAPSRCERLVGPCFASPTIDKPGPPALTYGTLLAGVNVCVRPLTKSGGAELRLDRPSLVTLLHQTLVLVLQQAALHRLVPPHEDDQKLSSDQLHGELKSFLDSLHRSQRATSHSPAPKHQEKAAAGRLGGDQLFLKLMEHLVNAVLK